MRKWMLLPLSLGVLGACGGGADSGGGAAVAGEPARPADSASAVVRTLDYDSAELRQVERRYAGGVALQVVDGAAALLTERPMDACTRLAVLARGSTEFGVFATAASPALVLVRNEEYPQGSVQLVEPGATLFLAEAIPTLQAGDGRFVARGEQAGQAPFEAQPSLQYDVSLPYASMAEFDPLAADGGPEAAWLRGLARQADTDPEATVDATFLEDEDDWNSYGARSTWTDVLANWDDFNVVAAASGPDCATLVVQAPGFVAGSRKAIVRARGPAGQRKVFAAESSEEHAPDGRYVVGRIEHPALGPFPILDARAESVPEVGTVLIFSDKPIGGARWEELVQRQRAVRAVAGMMYGNSYMLSSLEFAGPGVAPDTIPADTISNAYVDETSIAGLVSQGAPGEHRIVVNFQLPLQGPAPAP